MMVDLSLISSADVLIEKEYLEREANKKDMYKVSSCSSSRTQIWTDGALLQYMA